MDDKEFWKNERVAFLALSSVKGVGFWSLHKIADAEGSFKDALKDPELYGLEKCLIAAGYVGVPGQELLWSEGLSLARTLAQQGIRLLFRREPGFPQKLKEIPDAPEWIFVQGAIENLSSPAVAVVGTRKPSDDGLFLTRYAVACLAELRCVTVSGLALGIDQLAHAESIRYGLPTIAVLGTGILQNYPRGSEGMREEILAAGGSIVSEYLPHQSYSAESFVRRNRLQAALGDVLIPTEWNIKSGTAHTVKNASKYSKAIINLYLPFTFNARPELVFSATEYSASSIEVPTSTAALITLLKARVMGWVDESEPAAELLGHENQVVAVDVEAEPDSGQLPLL